MLKPWDQLPTVVSPLRGDNTSAEKPNDTGFLEETIDVCVIGAGLAGCWLARILAQSGVRVTLFEKNAHVALEASGNPAGIVKPFVTRSISSGMSFHCLAHEFLIDRLTTFGVKNAADFNQCGVLQLIHTAYRDTPYYSSISREASKQLSGTDTHSAALSFNNAGWLNPNALCQALVQHPNIHLQLGFQLTAIEKDAKNERHKLSFSNNVNVFSRHVVFTTGAAIQMLTGQHPIPLTPARGQMSHFNLRRDSDKLKCVVSGKHYAIPSKSGVYVGATFERGVTHSEVTEADHAANLSGLNELLPELKVQPEATGGHAGVRATTPDRIPLVGPLPDFSEAAEIYRDIRHGRELHRYPSLPCKEGLYMLSGLGSRGIVTAPLCAQLLATHLLGKSAKVARTSRTDSAICTEDEIDLQQWTPILNPARFLIRQLKRNASVK